MFLRLISVSGVGPSMALAALSTYSAEELRELIQSNQSARIQQIKGVGKKTAQRIVLDLSDKLGALETATSSIRAHSPQDEAVQALSALGLSRAEAERKHCSSTS